MPDEGLCQIPLMDLVSIEMVRLIAALKALPRIIKTVLKNLVAKF